MSRVSISGMFANRQYTLGYLLAEVSLVAASLAACRLASLSATQGIELQSLWCCLAATSAAGAIGGLCLRMVLGLVAGGVLSLAALPSLCLFFA